MAVLNYCVPPEYNDNALELLEKGAKKAGRKLDDFDRPQLIVCSVDHDHDKAIDHTKICSASTWRNSRISPKHPAFRRMWCKKSSPCWAGPPPKSKSTRPSTWCRTIWCTDHRLRYARGSPCKVEEYIKRGCTCPILYPVGGNFKLLIDTFAQK